MKFRSMKGFPDQYQCDWTGCFLESLFSKNMSPLQGFLNIEYPSLPDGQGSPRMTAKPSDGIIPCLPIF